MVSTTRRRGAESEADAWANQGLYADAGPVKRASLAGSKGDNPVDGNNTTNTRSDTKRAEEMRRRILDLTEEYYGLAHGGKPFVHGESTVPVSGRVYGASDMRAQAPGLAASAAARKPLY